MIVQVVSVGNKNNVTKTKDRREKLRKNLKDGDEFN